MQPKVPRSTSSPQAPRPTPQGGTRVNVLPWIAFPGHGPQQNHRQWWCSIFHILYMICALYHQLSGGRTTSSQSCCCAHPYTVVPIRGSPYSKSGDPLSLYVAEFQFPMTVLGYSLRCSSCVPLRRRWPRLGGIPRSPLFTTFLQIKFVFFVFFCVFCLFCVFLKPLPRFPRKFPSPTDPGALVAILDDFLIAPQLKN